MNKKFITTVHGIELFAIDLPEFVKDVSTRLACACSINKMSETSNTEVAIVQGNFANEIEALLVSDERLTQHGGVKGSTYHLPKTSIQVVLRKGVPARKKASTK